MKVTQKIFRLSILMQLILISVSSAQNIILSDKLEKKGDDYHLIWQDNFDGPKLDETNRWSIVVDSNGGGNRELQFYKRENIEVGKEPVSGENCLIIKAKKENYLQRKYTSGRLSTQHKVAFRYGKIEARIKLPKTANGLWPAFWMLGNDYPEAIWPKCGEIDILEMGNKKGIISGTQDRFFNGACHWGESFNNGSYPNYGISSINPYCLQDVFHLYTLIWDKDSVKMYLDMDQYPTNKPYFEMPINVKDEPNSSAHYFHKQFFIIFNLAVGGNFPEISHPSQVTALKEGEARMYVDYVKVYQKGIEGEEFKVFN